jgi:hypothetical protein
VSAEILAGLLLALASTTMTNLAYLREHDAAAALPSLSMRRPVHSLRLLLSSHGWMRGFAMEAAGFLLYAAALALAPLSLVQGVAAGGIGVLAFVSSRVTARQLGRREWSGVLLATVGLIALAASLAGGSGGGGRGSTRSILLWLLATALLALVVLSLRGRAIRTAVADGVAGGLFFSIGDISTKVATQGGARVAFVLTLIVGYMVGTSLLQIGYQAGGALTVAGLATLLTNLVPIVAGTVVLHEHIPSGPLGALRIVAFAAVSVGGLLLAQPDDPKSGRPVRATAPRARASH